MLTFLRRVLGLSRDPAPRVAQLRNELLDLEGRVDYLEGELRSLRGRVTGAERRKKAADDAPSETINPPAHIPAHAANPAAPRLRIQRGF